MRGICIHKQILSALLLLIAVQATPLAAQDEWDVRQPDTIIVGSVFVDSYPWPDSIGVPLYVWADDTLGALSIALHVDDSRLQLCSFDTTGTVFNQEGCTWTATVVDSEANSIGFGYFNALTNWTPNPQGLIGTVYLKPAPGIPGGSQFTIDSTFIAPAIFLEFTTVVNGYVHAVRPAPFFNGDGPNVEFSDAGYVCGDANGDGFANITDAVYLITYIFAGGDPPVPLLAGDANCDGTPNITDAVYLIMYIFAEGPEPCAECP